MTQFMLRCEGVNIAATIDDTSDLSTSRGGGMLLLEGVDWVGRHFNLDPIHVGASIGLFGFESNSEDDASRLRDGVDQSLRAHPDYRHCTFVVDWTPATGDFGRDEETLKAMNRWRQMRSPSIALPDPLEGAGICEETKTHPTRPAQKASVSVEARRTVGRDRKQSFIYGKLDRLARQRTQDNPAAGCTFADNFESLSTLSGENRDALGALDRKMAVIACDGNSFTPIRDRHCRDAATRAAWSVALEDFASGLMWDLVAEAHSTPDWKNGERIRFETLMWGGDEFVWVVPAWLGWRTVAFLQKRFSQWQFSGEPLRYATGIVFCHHKAPVHRVKRLAHDLCDIAKRDDRKSNRVAYQVLESFDHYGLAVEKLRADRMPRVLAPDKLILAGESIDEFLTLLAKLKAGLSRRSVSTMLSRLHETSDGDALAGAYSDAVGDLDGQIFVDLQRAADLSGGDFAVWLHLAEMWDYVLD